MRIGILGNLCSQVPSFWNLGLVRSATGIESLDERICPRFLDTNILLRLFTRDDEAKARLALALLQRVERGEEKLIVMGFILIGLSI